MISHNGTFMHIAILVYWGQVAQVYHPGENNLGLVSTRNSGVAGGVPNTIKGCFIAGGHFSNYQVLARYDPFVAAGVREQERLNHSITRSTRGGEMPKEI